MSYYVELCRVVDVAVFVVIFDVCSPFSLLPPSFAAARSPMNNVDVAFLVGGVFALLASVVSLWSVYVLPCLFLAS
jgi:hypothetical protein